MQQPLFLKNVICFSITASHFGKSSLRFKIINQVENGLIISRLAVKDMPSMELYMVFCT